MIEADDLLGMQIRAYAFRLVEDFEAHQELTPPLLYPDNEDSHAFMGTRATAQRLAPCLLSCSSRVPRLKALARRQLPYGAVRTGG